MKEKWTPHIIAVTAFVVFIVLGLACASTPESDVSDSGAQIFNEPESADKYFERGEKYKEQKEWQMAIFQYNNVIRLDPNFVKAYINRGLSYKEWGKAEVSSDVTSKEKLTKALEYYDLALSDLNKALELNTIPDNKQLINGSIAEAKTEKGKIETNLAAKIAQEKALEEANRRAEEADRRAKEEAKKNFIIIPENWNPAKYTKVDLFAAVAASEKLSANHEYWGSIDLGPPSRDFVSEVLFVSQNGTDITFRTADNAIRKTMKVGSRTGLTAGQKVRIYYSAYRIKDWTIDAIERM